MEKFLVVSVDCSKNLDSTVVIPSKSDPEPIRLDTTQLLNLLFWEVCYRVLIALE
jgi:hypothetical protein